MNRKEMRAYTIQAIFENLSTEFTRKDYEQLQAKFDLISFQAIKNALQVVRKEEYIIPKDGRIAQRYYYTLTE